MLYHESTFCEDKLERAKQTMHSTAMEAANVAKEAQASHLLLGHFSARYRNLDQFVIEAKTLISKYIACQGITQLQGHRQRYKGQESNSNKQ